MIHKLVAPLQHQTADQHYVISWHCQCDSCHWPAILDRWCNWCHWCATGKKQGRYRAGICHPFSAPLNQCAMTTWSWPSCCEVEYDRHSLRLPRGMQIYSYWDVDDGKNGNTCSLWWFSADESKIQDMAVPKDVDQHGDSTDRFKSSPPCWLQWSGNWHVCFFNTMTSSRWFAPCLPFDWGFSSASYWSCDWSPRTYICNAQYCSPSL